MLKKILNRILAVFYLLKSGKFKRLYRRALKPLFVSGWTRGLRRLLRIRTVCDRFPSGITILSDGNVTTCCVDVYGKSIFASVYEKDLSGIWNTKIYPKFLNADLYDIKDAFIYKFGR